MNSMTSRENSQSRREFLRMASTGVAGAVLIGAAPSILTRTASAQEGGKKLGVALVGLGSLSTNQIAPGLQKTKYCRLAGIVTGTPSKAKVWSEKYKIPEKNIYNYDTFDKIADNPDIDIVYVVLPNSMHPEYTIRAAKAGKHVLCEKPMANSAKECEQMIAACKKANRKLAIGYRCHFELNNRECMRLAAEKTFGQVRMIEAGFGFRIGDPTQWRLKKAMAGGGALMDVGIYALQACRFISGEEPAVITAQETKTDKVKFKDVDESIVWTMTFPSGIIAYCSTTYLVNGINRYTAYGDKGWFGLDPAYSYDGIGGKRSDGQKIAMPQVDQFATEMDDFAQCVLYNRTSSVSGEEGLRDLKVIEAIYKSIHTGKAVHLG